MDIFPGELRQPVHPSAPFWNRNGSTSLRCQYHYKKYKELNQNN